MDQGSLRRQRRQAKRSKENNQSRRLLSLAAVLDGMNRMDAARIGGMDRQTLLDWIHRFDEAGPTGCGTIGRVDQLRVCRRIRRPNSRRSSKRARQGG
jgi:hypothetical protein